MTGVPATIDPLPRHSRAVRLGRVLIVPLLLGLVLSAGAGRTVTVRRGDTLWGLAQRHGTTVERLRALNDIPGNSSLIYAGQQLRVSGERAAPRVGTVRRYHTVVRGDTLIGIARRYRKSPGWVAARNKLPRSQIVILGQRLVVGVSRPAPRRSTAGRPRPVSREYARSLIRAEARRAGVDVNLALAVAYLESGFQQDVVSHAGAVGVMQVMPQTGAWVAQYVVGRPLNLARVEDNVVAGVRYLALLVRITGRERSALAGYYQGLASVRRNGLYTDTKRYIKNIQALKRRFARG